VFLGWIFKKIYTVGEICSRNVEEIRAIFWLDISYVGATQNAGRSHNMKIDNWSFEMVEEFKYFGAALTNQNSIREEIKSRLKSGNACYHSVQNCLSSSPLSKNTEL
jgi:hypothetical protein